ncbi:MAG: response regulator [bacterium]|nr:response regulator [bacterium]
MQTILVADDDEGILDVVKIVLEEDNKHRVVLVSEADSLLERIKAEKPDLILLDIWMPGCDGRELTKKLKSDKETRNIPVLLVSAYNDIEGKAKEAGADGFIEKPFDIEDLKAKVSQYLAK